MPDRMRSLNEYILTVEVPDVSTTDSAGYVIAPDAGKIVKAYSVTNATTTGTAVLTLSVDGGTDVTQTITIAAGAAGVMDSCVPADNNAVLHGSVIKVISNGGSTNAALARVTLVIRR